MLVVEQTCNADPISTFQPFYVLHILPEPFKGFKCFVVASDPESTLRTTLTSQFCHGTIAGNSSISLTCKGKPVALCSFLFLFVPSQLQIMRRKISERLKQSQFGLQIQ